MALGKQQYHLLATEKVVFCALFAPYGLRLSLFSLEAKALSREG